MCLASFSCISWISIFSSSFIARFSITFIPLSGEDTVKVRYEWLQMCWTYKWTFRWFVLWKPGCYNKGGETWSNIIAIIKVPVPQAGNEMQVSKGKSGLICVLTSRSRPQPSRPPPASAALWPVSPGLGLTPPPPAGSYGSGRLHLPPPEGKSRGREKFSHLFSFKSSKPISPCSHPENREEKGKAQSDMDHSQI